MSREFAELLTPEEAHRRGCCGGASIKQLNNQAMNKKSCQCCDEPVWRLMGLGLCFSCVTGESDMSDDVELILIEAP